MKKLPIAEHFHSLQGEGTYSGVPMLFIRTAGCNVGSRPEYGECVTVDGRRFICDTDYHKIGEFTLKEIIDPSPEEHICITGGEPFLHDLRDVEKFPMRKFHFETSGTLPLPRWTWDHWVACSPKQGFLQENINWIDEWKFLVDENFPFADPETAIRHVIGDSEAPVFLQPINGIHAFSQEHLELCTNLLLRYPHWRLSLQTHKLIGLQ